MQKKLKHTKITRRPSVSRQNSKTGTVTECNEVQIALFRYGEEVFAFDEKCPHAGEVIHLVLMRPMRFYTDADDVSYRAAGNIE